MQITNTILLLTAAAVQVTSGLVISQAPDFDRFPTSLSCPSGHGRVSFIKDQELYNGLGHAVRPVPGTITQFNAGSVVRGLLVSLEVSVDVGQGRGGHDKVIYQSGSARTAFGRCTEHGNVV